MDLLLKKIRLFQSGSGRPFKTVDILIKDGKYSRIAKDIKTPKGIEALDINNAHASIGWMDVGIQIGEPGFEHREDFDSISNVAALGGFTTIASFPNSDPIIDNKAQIEFVKTHGYNSAVAIKAIGAISKNCEGKDLAELYDMHNSGALAFSDGNKSLQSSGLMLRALQYTKGFSGVVINSPNDHSISKGGQINEGALSISLGLKGIPHLAEELMVQRDIELAEYSDSKVHIANVSTANSIDLIRKAKKRGIKVTCSVPIMNLIFEEENLSDFDVNYKVWPPLRTLKDRKALKKGLVDRTVDFISSNHVPLENELKKKEFLYAEFGVISLGTLFPMALRIVDEKFTLSDLLYHLAVRPREVFGLEIPKVEIGETANLTIFQPKEEWMYKISQVKSKSKNSPLLNNELVGKVAAIINNNRIVKNS